LDITGMPMYKRARKGIGYLAQEASVFRNLTVRQNIETVLQFHNYSKKEIREKSDRLIEEFSLEKVTNGKGYSLSGGERRRTEIARALATDPKFILLDEPFAGVDPIAVEDIQEIVSKLKHQNIGILITDHNVHETLAITNRAYLMFEGKILMEGDADTLANDEKARKLYLGETFKLDRYQTNP
ncbi:MAG: LPS export ABC transporter ATP-binding protein, partial [Balneolales bacterium]|nr:LPS export ABC transporter ATP-binding protein [Balneolales bacterium]